jgi:histidinol-phosphate aminotransferase
MLDMYIHIDGILFTIGQSEFEMLQTSMLLRPELSQLSPYNAGLTIDDVAKRCGNRPIAKLGSNENPFGHAPEVRAAMQKALETAHVYPDPHGRHLAKEISKLTDAPVEGVILGDGSEDLLNVLARCLLRQGDDVATLYPSFPLHEDYARMMGANIIRIDLTPDHRIDIDAVVAAVARPVRLSIFANPMNPTGLWLTGQELDLVLHAQHPDSVLCLDEAYVEYALGGDYVPGSSRLADHRKPLLILRTFSKAYGLAAVRVGYGISNNRELIRGMNLVRTPFNVNSVAQAGAIAALQHPEKMLAAVAMVLIERARMTERLKQFGLEVMPSKGNFLFVDGKRSATTLADHLIDLGVIVKPWKQTGYETFFRVSVGLESENTQFLEALSGIL